MKIPKTIKKLPTESFVAVYDAKANHPGKPEVLPGTTMSIGAAYGRWSPIHPPFEIGNTWHNSNLNRHLFFHSMRTSVPMGEESQAFWQPHPAAREWSTGDTPRDTAWHAFFMWLYQLVRTEIPVVLVAAPHSYDVQHILMGRETLGGIAEIVHEWFPNKVLFADCAELYATHHRLPLPEGKDEWKRRFMPKNLLHHPTFDSMVQLNALFAGLHSDRKIAID